MRRALIIFARAPLRGFVKTRLAAAVGDDEALAVYLELGTRVAAQTAAGDWTRIVAFTPDDAEEATRAWLAGNGDPSASTRPAAEPSDDRARPRAERDGIRFFPQGEGDLGTRMARAIQAQLTDGAPRVVVIGTDCPDVDAGIVEQAFAALDETDVVYGPAADGGYYLVGVSRHHPALFERMTWSAPDVLAVSLARAAEAGLQVRLLEELADIDRHEELRAWRARTGRSQHHS